MPRVWMLLLIAVVLGIYARCFFNGFAYDDKGAVRVPSIEPSAPNAAVADLQPLSTYFTTTYNESHGGHGRGFRPLTTMSFALVHHLTEYREPPDAPDSPRAPAGPQHVVNVILHCGATWLTFEILALFLGLGIPAVLGAAVFGLHALRSDPVISIVGRAEIMGYGFGAAALLLYVAGLRHRGAGRFSRIGAAALCLFLALCSKESAAPWVIMLPLTALALRYRETGDHETPGLRDQILPFAIAGALPLGIFLFFLLRLWSGLTEDFTASYGANPLFALPATQRIANGVMLLGYGLYKVVYPFHLACDYGEAVFDIASGLSDWRVLLAGAVLLAGLFAGLANTRRHPLLFVAVAVFFGFTFMVSNIPMAIETNFGERLYYTPATALSLVVAWLASRATTSIAKRVGIALLGGWLVVCCVVIVLRCGAWRDDRSLFMTDAVGQPKSLQLQMATMQYLRDGDPAVWKRRIDHAMTISPGAIQPVLELTFFYRRFGQFAAAEAAARRGLLSKHPGAEQYRGELHRVLAEVLMRQGRPPAEVEREYRAALALDGDREPRVHISIAQFLVQTNRRKAAKAALETAVAKFPDALDAWDLRLRFAQEDAEDGAIQRLIAAGRPHLPGAPHFDVHAGILAHRQGDRQKALEYLARSVPRLPRDVKTAEYWHRFAVVLAESQRLDEARSIASDYLRMRLPRPVLQPFSALATRLGMR